MSRPAETVRYSPNSPYATPSATREVLERHGLYTKYKLGQNFLVNDDVIGKILELSKAEPDDRVLEVGPGIGTLTAALLPRVAHVTAIEIDRDLPVVLADTLSQWSERFSLVQEDALKVKKAQLTNAMSLSKGADSREVELLPNKLISNLPYAIAATVVLDYLQRFEFLESATVMVQKEVADRMTAQPGSKTYGAYTVKLSLFARVTGRFAVSPGSFFPPPRVESAVVRLDREVACDSEERELSSQVLIAACEMADAAFANRRKKLVNSCKSYFANCPDVLGKLSEIFEQACVNPSCRGETLTTQDFVKLGQAKENILG